MGKGIFNDQKKLTRFIWKLRMQPDTPALIQFIAADEGYLMVCSRIVNDASDAHRDLALLRDVCLKQEFDFQLLKERLTPVARAFGLVEDESSYYELLGVARDTDAGRIKKAFRKRVIEVHPDTGDQKSDSCQEFMHLKTAYQILGDPSLRRKYDETLQDVSLWKEKADQISRFQRFKHQNFQKVYQKQAARTKIYYQLGALFLLLIIVVFILDFIYRQNAILDNDYSVKESQTLEQNLTKAAVRENFAPKTGPSESKAESLPNAADNSRIQQKFLTDYYETSKTQGGKAMSNRRKKTLILRVFVVLLSFAVATAGFSTNGGSARIIPSGKVLMIKDGQVIGEFSNEAPLPVDTVLKCEARCSVQLDDVYMVVEKDTVFSVQPMADRHELYVQEGAVYYSLSETSRPLHITTPAGDATTGNLLFSETELRGYVRVSGNETEIGVLGGGTMMVQTASGEMAVTPGRQITIAAVGSETTGAAAEETGGFTRNQKIAAGVIGGALFTTGMIALTFSGGGNGGGGGDGDDDGSPAAP